MGLENHGQQQFRLTGIKVHQTGRPSLGAHSQGLKIGMNGPAGLALSVGWTKEIPMADLSAKARDKLPAKDFAEPKTRAYPIEDKPHASNAKARATQAVKAGRMAKAEATRIDKKADAVLKGDG